MQWTIQYLIGKHYFKQHHIEQQKIAEFLLCYFLFYTNKPNENKNRKHFQNTDYCIYNYNLPAMLSFCFF